MPALPALIALIASLWLSSLGATFYFARDMGRTECRAAVVTDAIDFIERRRIALRGVNERNQTRADGSAYAAERRNDRFLDALDVIAAYEIELGACRVPGVVRDALGAIK